MEIRSLLTSGGPFTGTGAFNFPYGFPDAGVLALNGGVLTTFQSNDLDLTDGGGNEARSVFYGAAVPVGSFTTDFSFQVADAQADGLTFCIQGDGPTALGGSGGMLGYGGMPKSVAVKFDLYDNKGEGTDSTGLYTGGAEPTNLNSVDLTPSGVRLNSGDVIDVTISYDGSTLAATETDAQTGASATQSYPNLDIPALVGGAGAWVGFTAGTGGLASTQQLDSWDYAGAPNSANTYDLGTSDPSAGTPATAVLAGAAGSAADQAGNVGGAISLDGTDEADAADAANPDPLLDPGGSLTVAAWIDATDWNGNRRIVQKSTVGADNQYRLTAEYGQLKFDVAGVGSVTGPLPSAGAWHHVAGTFDGAALRLYEDGALVASVAAGGVPASESGPLVIGNKPGSTVPGDHFVGAIGGVEVDDIALTSGQIGDLAGLLPSAPTNVAAYATSGTGAFISWNDDGTADGYDIQESTDGTHFTTIQSVDDPTATGVLVTGLSPSTTYTFAVVAYNATGTSAATAAAPITTPANDTTGWYQVISPDANATTGIISIHHDQAQDTSTSALEIAGNGIVQAGSAAEALLEAVAGTVTNTATGRSYVFGSSGAFRYVSDYVTTDATDLGPAGTDVGPAIAFEDLWQVDPSQYDWNDDFLRVKVQSVPELVAVDDYAATPEDTPVTVSVLDNDTDADNGTISLVSVTNAQHGAAAIDGNSVTYTPNQGFDGDDSFTYTITDSEGQTATATVHITVAQDDPQLKLVYDGTYTNPDGSGIDLVGAQGAADLETISSGNADVQQVQWYVDGAYAGQTYSDDTGYTEQPLVNPTVDASPQPSGMVSQVRFFWNAAARTHQIEALVTTGFDNQGQPIKKIKTISVQVLPPKVNEFRDTFLAMDFSVLDKPNQPKVEVGLWQPRTNPNPPADGRLPFLPGEALTANVNTAAPPQGVPANSATSVFAFTRVILSANNFTN